MSDTITATIVDVKLTSGTDGIVQFLAIKPSCAGAPITARAEGGASKGEVSLATVPVRAAAFGPGALATVALLLASLREKLSFDRASDESLLLTVGV